MLILMGCKFNVAKLNWFSSQVSIFSLVKALCCNFPSFSRRIQYFPMGVSVECQYFVFPSAPNRTEPFVFLCVGTFTKQAPRPLVRHDVGLRFSKINFAFNWIHKGKELHICSHECIEAMSQIFGHKLFRLKRGSNLTRFFMSSCTKWIEYYVW